MTQEMHKLWKLVKRQLVKMWKLFKASQEMEMELLVKLWRPIVGVTVWNNVSLMEKLNNIFLLCISISISFMTITSRIIPMNYVDEITIV